MGRLTELEEFAGELTAVNGRPTSHRPFIVEGSPLTCRVFVVGINPATKLRAGFWDFWEPGYGFRKPSQPVHVLETNVYSVEKPEPGRGELWTADAFDFLFERIRTEARTP